MGFSLPGVHLITRWLPASVFLGCWRYINRGYIHYKESCPPHQGTKHVRTVPRKTWGRITYAASLPALASSAAHFYVLFN